MVKHGIVHFEMCERKYNLHIKLKCNRRSLQGSKHHLYNYIAKNWPDWPLLVSVFTKNILIYLSLLVLGHKLLGSSSHNVCWLKNKYHSRGLSSMSYGRFFFTLSLNIILSLLFIMRYLYFICVYTYLQPRTY